MPIIWRYLIKHYIKVLCFCVISFISILLTTRLQEIANFAALGAQGNFVFLFAVYQIPYILPIAIPVSCVISSMLLVNRLSTTYEMTALRASGMALKNILTPIMLAASCVGLLNFYVVSELATNSHLKTKMLEQELRSINPLLLLENRQLSKYKGIYVNSMGPSRVGESASDLVVAIANRRNNRMGLLLAKEVKTDSLNLHGSHMTLMNSFGVNTPESFDHLIVENMKSMSTSSKDFLQVLKTQNGGRISTDYLKLSLLLLRTDEDFKNLRNADPKDKPAYKLLKKKAVRDITEMLRRISLGIAPITLTLLGIAFGINISRRTSNRNIFYVICLATLFLVSYFIAKGINRYLIPTILLYILPHVIIIFSSIFALKKISKGIE